MFYKMDFQDPLEVDYGTVASLLEAIEYCVESISLSFDRWDDPYTHGPGLYFLVVAGARADTYADPLGENRWPVDKARVVTDDLEAFIEAARSVAFERDGAVIISADGTIQEQMVRVKGLSQAELTELDDTNRIQYADWMGTRHLSAVEASTRDEVIAAITLSEEDGRVTTFQDGQYNDRRYEELGGKWRNSE